MSSRRAEIAEAAASLARRDPVVAALVKRYGAPTLGRPTPVSERFAVLARSILYQQLAGSAARAIHGRFVGALEGTVTPEGISAAGGPALRACGLSGAKTASILDLAEKVTDGRVALDRLGRLDDESVVAELTKVRGIGPWTAQMFLLSSLGRLDVWPVGDLGVRSGFATAWHLKGAPSPERLERLGEPFRPYRSLIAWYCWRAADEGRTQQTPRPTEPTATSATAPTARRTAPATAPSTPRRPPASKGAKRP